jgi:hypothetical protein
MIPCAHCPELACPGRVTGVCPAGLEVSRPLPTDATLPWPELPPLPLSFRDLLSARRRVERPSA